MAAYTASVLTRAIVFALLIRTERTDRRANRPQIGDDRHTTLFSALEKQNKTIIDI